MSTAGCASKRRRIENRSCTEVPRTGVQLTDPNAALRPISYYGDQSAVGMVYRLFTEAGKRRPVKIGAIGLGVGTLAAYARSAPYADAAPGERSVVFYELDREVAEISRAHFTYLTQGNPSVKIRFGDARTALEQEPPQQFDILVVDAFTGDGIPIHLLTRAALELYERICKQTARSCSTSATDICASRV